MGIINEERFSTSRPLTAGAPPSPPPPRPLPPPCCGVYVHAVASRFASYALLDPLCFENDDDDGGDDDDDADDDDDNGIDSNDANVFLNNGIVPCTSLVDLIC